ncbi:hypothetical protein QBC35DRAFT_100425 [Podospora australis]|uniref:Protein YAE1 n=1 Tax=Podospora australis TaxID=1536484 RepID=A0AAN6X3N9_9PEZI|nr:hypothetical protein QBC35DRAFT_100425 [Podospora australis]
MLLRHTSGPEDRDEDIFHSMTSHNPNQTTTQEMNAHPREEEENPDMFDDVWGDDDDQTISSQNNFYQNDTRPTAVPQSDISRLQQEHTTAGYRDGITRAKASSVQAGFDEGFSLGATIGARAGQLLGLLEGLAAAIGLHSLNHSSPQTSEEVKRIGDLLAEARKELAVTSIFSPTFWAEDGTWIYPVQEGQVVQGEIVFADVAAAHPLVRKWDGIVRAEAAGYGVDWEVLKDEAEDVRRDEIEGRRDDNEEIKKNGEVKPAAKGSEALAW